MIDYADAKCDEIEDLKEALEDSKVKEGSGSE
jgi:hypothetical protein